MNHLMLDLETIGKRSNAGIIAIGAAFFCPHTGQQGKTFYVNVDIHSSIERGLSVNGSTIQWWMQQSDNARAIFNATDAVELECALHDLIRFINANANDFNTLQVWGNGASFDCVILRNAYTACEMLAPWQYWNERDVRTVVELGKQIDLNPKKKNRFEGTQHNALDNASHQVNYVREIWQALLAPHLFRAETE